jgi:GNAT superfamily N-acetyltransferase
VPKEVQVRAARADDKHAIVAFCQNTFSWGDYIPDVWDDWLDDHSGQLLVGVVDREPVGLLHVAFLGNATAWMEGMRVHPDFRRQGIGRAIDATGRALARERGCRVARLATSVKNLAAQKLLAMDGYARIAQFNEWECKPALRKILATRVATRDDAGQILEVWRASATDETRRALLPDRRWHWHELTDARLLDQIDAGEVRIADGGFAFLFAFDENDWSGMSLHALVGDEERAFALALAARSEARYRGYPRLEAILVDHAPLNTALERAGYRRQGGMFIYEQAL